MNGEGIETPSSKLATAQATLGLAVRINAEVVAGRLRRTVFEREVVLHTGGTGLVLPRHPQGTRADLQSGTQNLVQIALSASALTADETLGEVYGPLDSDTDRNRWSLRLMVYHLRNAFARNPWRPTWRIFKKQHIGTFPMVLDDGTEFVFDTSHLHGDGVKPEQVGGLEFWVKLLQHFERALSRASRGPQVPA